MTETKLADTARDIAAALSMTQDGALTLATTYAAQLGYPAPEAGQAPELVVSAEDDQHIVRAACIAHAGECGLNLSPEDIVWFEGAPTIDGMEPGEWIAAVSGVDE